MPYASQAQTGYFHTHKAELEREGVNVSEWDQASKGMKLPPKRAATPRERIRNALTGDPK